MVIVPRIISAVVLWSWLFGCLTSKRLWPPQDPSGQINIHSKIKVQLLKSWKSFANCERLNQNRKNKKIKKSSSLMWGPAAIWHKVNLLVYFRDNVVGNKTCKDKLMKWWHILQFLDPNTFTFTFFAYDVVQHRLVFICLWKSCFSLCFT